MLVSIRINLSSHSSFAILNVNLQIIFRREVNWTGIGAVGSVIVGSVWFHDQLSPITWLFVVLLIVSIVGIKLTSTH